MSVYNELHANQQLCDALIRVDNVEFFVHKIILCNCSSFFRDLFTVWATPDDHDFEISLVSADLLKPIIDFAYTDSISVTVDNVQELFIAADKLGVIGVVEACTSFMEGQLTSQNCIGIWWLTGFYYTTEMNRKVFNFIMKNFMEIAAASEEFLQLSVQDLVTIIEKDELNVKQESTVVEAILRWITHATEERREHIYWLLSNVRLALTGPKYLTDTLSNNELVRESGECQQIISETLDVMLNPLTQSPADLVSPRLPTEILFATGGWSQNGPNRAIETYDVRANSWVNIPNDYGSPRAHHGLVFLNGSLYHVGGYDGTEWFNSHHRFDLSTHTWHELSHMHFSRGFSSTTLLDGYIYAMGGYDGVQGHRSAERYDPIANQWTIIMHMNEQRSDASCATFNGKIYICGGYTGGTHLSTAESYDPASDQWTPIANMSTRRSGVGVVAYAGRIYAVGGFDGSSRLQTVEAYNPDTNTWRDMPPMPGRRSNFGIEVIDDRLFVVGGYNGTVITRDVYCFDINTGEWSTVCNMNTSRSALSCCVVHGLPNLAKYAAPR